MPSATKDQITVNEEYLKKHNIPVLFERLTTLLLHNQPENPRAFLVEQLKAYRQYKGMKIGTSPLNVFSKDDILGLFRIYDVTRKGTLNRAQFMEAMRALGAPAAVATPLPDNDASEPQVFPDWVNAVKGATEDSITTETFLEAANNSLSSVEFH